MSATFDEIARDLRKVDPTITDEQIQKALDELEEEGKIEVERRTRRT